MTRFPLIAAICLTVSVSSAHEIKVFPSRHAFPEGGGKATIFLS